MPTNISHNRGRMELQSGSRIGPRMICLSNPFGIVEGPTPAGTLSVVDAQHSSSSSNSSNEGWAALPTDVLGLVARELGLHEAQAMTRVCRGWLHGVDRTLTQLKPRNLHAVQMAKR